MMYIWFDVKKDNMTISVSITQTLIFTLYMEKIGMEGEGKDWKGRGEEHQVAKGRKVEDLL